LAGQRLRVPLAATAKPTWTVEDEARAASSSDFGMLLRRFRIAAGLSQEALAERAHMSANGIGALERGYRRTPQRETVALLATALALTKEEHQRLEASASRHARARRGASVAIGPWPHAGTELLPLALTSFVGRKAELGEIAALLREYRLVTITGAGGVGKTQTALQAVTELGDPAEGGICFVELAPINEPSLVVAAIAAKLGVQEVPNRPLLETLVAYLKSKTLLLILDNCEHLVAPIAHVAQTILAGCSRVRILATSREPLVAAGERTYRLPSLSSSDATTLFIDRAQAVDAHFALSGENAPAVSEICRRLDGIPLAIELAAAHVNVLAVTALAEKLDDLFRFLVGGQRTALPRQQTMRATIDWSYNLLTEPEKRLFERLSVFVGGCTLESATTACASEDVPEADMLDLLSSLVDKSLVVADLDATEPRYSLLESFRHYARERLEARGEGGLFARRHALACLELAEWFNRAFDCEDAAEVRARASFESANWRAALQWTLAERGDVVLGQRLAGELGPYFSFFLATARNTFFFGHTEGRRWIIAALQLTEEGTPSSALAALSYAEARIAGTLREYRAELESSKIALSRYRELGDSLGVVRAQCALSHALIYLRRPDEASAVLEEALRLARELGVRTPFTVACLLRLKALVTQDDIVAARGYIAEAMAIHSALNHESSLASALLDLSECEYRAGNLELALEHATQSLAVAPEGNAFAEFTALHTISLYLTALDRYDEAYERARATLDLAKEYRCTVYVAWALGNLATTTILRAGVEPERRTAVYELAARTLGFVDARLVTSGSARLPLLQPRYERVLDMLRDAMGPQKVSDLMAAGAEMTEQQAVEEATE
jgi:predicted ATPase/DNA-binding XRE family transcriptional regulator